MAISGRIQYGSFTIDAVTRTPITMPRGCSKIVLRNTDLVRTCALYDASTGGNALAPPLQPGGEKEFNFTTFCGAADEILCWATAASGGTGPIAAEYYS